ncbi:MAG: hypothetical protein A2Z18_05390 [Armatimonadetes bacterium RBG_16_58_9]|nr:MAG: hypothetical protein A2Z18_05390 [Armatimonadetes bacterium RBG_16_58_9]
MSASAAGLVLAAGRGSRFESEPGRALPKVLCPLLGRPMIDYVLGALAGAGVDDITLIVGHGADKVIRQLGDSVDYVRQNEQLGSGHAVACAKERFRDFDGCLVVMCGDSPLFTAETVRRMIDKHIDSNAAVTLTTAMLPDPFGYGRVLRDATGGIRAIVEEQCATDDQRLIREVNGGAYAFDSIRLFPLLRQQSILCCLRDFRQPRCRSNGKMRLNEAGEYNLTDMVRVFIEQGNAVASIECDPVEITGVNTVDDLHRAEEVLRNRQCA